MDLPPPPPAIHAPVPGQQVANAMQSLPFRSVQRLVAETTKTLMEKHPGFAFRWLHIKHHKGRKHKSQSTRSNKRKAARRAKHRR